MLTPFNYQSVQSSVVGHLTTFSLMKRYKSSIQNEIIPLITPQELSDIKLCRLNFSLVEKLAKLGKKHFYESDQSDISLYCICMAIGTIIKEYDWGIAFIQQEGMCKMATMIVN